MVGTRSRWWLLLLLRPFLCGWAPCSRWWLLLLFPHFPLPWKAHLRPLVTPPPPRPLAAHFFVGGPWGALISKKKKQGGRAQMEKERITQTHLEGKGKASSPRGNGKAAPPNGGEAREVILAFLPFSSPRPFRAWSAVLSAHSGPSLALGLVNVVKRKCRILPSLDRWVESRFPVCGTPPPSNPSLWVAPECCFGLFQLFGASAVVGLTLVGCFGTKRGGQGNTTQKGGESITHKKGRRRQHKRGGSTTQGAGGKAAHRHKEERDAITTHRNAATQRWKREAPLTLKGKGKQHHPKERKDDRNWRNHSGIDFSEKEKSFLSSFFLGP